MLSGTGNGEQGTGKNVNPSKNDRLAYLVPKSLFDRKE